jgi:DNA-binding NtrC family response regulator
LATVYGIVKQNRGCLYVSSKEGHGATFQIFLPRSTEDRRPVRLADPERETERGRGTILLVEDDDTVRELSEEILREQGYQVLTAATGQEALTLTAEHKGTIDLLLTDVVMPGMSGPALAQELTRRSPQIRILFMSGYPDKEIDRHTLDTLDIDLLTKPFHMDELVDKVRAALAD